MNTHHITKSLFVGAAIAGIGMSSGKAEIKFAPAARQQLEEIVRNRLFVYYEKLNAVAPGYFTQKDLGGCLKNDLSVIMGALLDTDSYHWGSSFFLKFQDIFYTTEDPEEQKVCQPFALSRDRFKDPNEFAWKFFQNNPHCWGHLKSRLGDLLSLASNHGKEGIGNALVREGFAEKVPGYAYRDKTGRFFTFKEKELDILDRDTLRRMMDIYYPEAAKSFRNRESFNYSMYVFFDRIFPPTNSLYAMGSLIFECACEYQRVTEHATNNNARVAAAGKLTEILGRVRNILLACERGDAFRGEEHFTVRPYNRKDWRSKEYLKEINKACEAFEKVVREKAKKLDQKIEEMLPRIPFRSMMHIWADSANR